MIDRMITSRGVDNFDFRFIGLVLAILGLGVLSIYSVTHDQGVAFPFYAKQLVWILLGTVAFLIMWPTILTILLAPFLIGRYVLLAREEDRELEKEFGDEFRHYREAVPPFIPSIWRQTISS